ncbi:serine protease [Allobranchiibius sp. GilTou73]|uniref:trypsin-like serine peptidase n=1 Tax=Allobranchiibius sp. GilTou73 TaxID=2904523 RepID=UPI001F2B802B|nr:trypsin-like peptidase domain-containing protein [Allobranchiibius sp. GilTou73]UIJ34261.1 serine protease [Allobranchiibius sp. GilTou73]
MKRVIATIAAGLGAAGTVLGAATAPASAASSVPSARATTPTASTSPGVPTVGTLFTDGFPGRHSCTASVIASPTHDLLLTAGHCVSGTAAGWLFVPAYDGMSALRPAPYGVWKVERAYVAPRWKSVHDTQYDYAILQVAGQRHGWRTVQVQDLTGGNVLSTAPQPGTEITDVAYNGGASRPVSCTVPTYLTDGYPAFNCDGYVGGSSGSPWLSAIPGSQLKAVRGVIGGLHQGGCYSYTSYSSSFTSEVFAVYNRAVSGSAPDTVTPAGSDGC